MNPSNRYLKFVQWSDADAAYVGFCPDLFPYGGVCHAPTEPEAFATLCAIVEETITDAQAEGTAASGVPDTPDARGGGTLRLRRVRANSQPAQAPAGDFVFVTKFDEAVEAP